MTGRPPRPTLFPYTTLFRSSIAFATPPEFVAPALGTLRRGINLGNGLDAPSIGAWGVVLEERHFELAARAGFDHVRLPVRLDRKSTRLNSSHSQISYAVFCL